MLNVAMVQAVQDLIRPRKFWTTYALARDRNGEEVPPRSKEACAWCSAGAIKRELGPDLEVQLRWKLDDAAAELFPGHLTIIRLNDHEGHDAVMQCLDHVKEQLQ